MDQKNDRGFFPLFVDLQEKRVLVVGAGRIAARRIRTLSDFCRHILVVAPRLDRAVTELESEGRCRCLRREFLPDDLRFADLVLAATDDASVDERIYSLCKQLHIPVNISSDQNRCDFQFPAIVKEEEIVIGINAGGKNHRLVRKVREMLEKSGIL